MFHEYSLTAASWLAARGRKEGGESLGADERGQIRQVCFGHPSPSARCLIRFSCKPRTRHFGVGAPGQLHFSHRTCYLQFGPSLAVFRDSFGRLPVTAFGRGALRHVVLMFG
jgi:hypothetical protein